MVKAVEVELILTNHLQLQRVEVVIPDLSHRKFCILAQ